MCWLGWTPELVERLFRLDWISSRQDRRSTIGNAPIFFVLSKLLGFFAIPSNLVILTGIVGFLLLTTRFARAGRGLAFASLIILAILGLSPIGNVLIIPLEDRFPPWDAARGAPDGIIVLGGAISPDVSVGRGQPALNEAAERMT